MKEMRKKEGKYRHCFYQGNTYESAKNIEPQDADIPPPAIIVRKNQADMTNDEKEGFKAAYTALINTGFMSSHVGIHSNMTHRMHGTSSGPIGFQRFLPWHRVYLHRLEEALRQVDPDLFIPYWKWTADQQIPNWLTTFTPNGITRNPGNPSAPNLPSEQAISSIMQESSFTPFVRRLEGVPFGAHNQVHVWVGGTMGSVPGAPADPLFWLHHAECDRLWNQWQQNNPGQNPILIGSNAILDPWPERFDEVLNIGAMGYTYA